MNEYKICCERGLEILSEESGYFFVRDKDGVVYPVRDTTIAEWVKSEKTNQ